MIHPIGITAISSISPLGITPEDAWNGYLSEGHCFSRKDFCARQEWVAGLPDLAKEEISRLRLSNTHYKDLDQSVLFAIHTANRAIKGAGWSVGDNFGINIGSSRGATALFEKYHGEYLRKNKASTLSSPTTTLGNISSWVAHDLQAKGPAISHSITCSTALHALLNGIAWIRSGMSKRFLVGGSEAPLTPFTIAQMRALKIYSNAGTEEGEGYPSRALDLQKKGNSMVLGEAASVACIEAGVTDNSLAIIEGIGYATETLEHSVSLSADAHCLQDSMKMAMGDLPPGSIDVVVMHSPGTVKGDLAEFRAVKEVFGDTEVALTGNKWKIGHTFGASGMLSIEMAVLMLQHQEFIPVPYVDYTSKPSSINRVLVNAVGFGGNAVSILLKRK